MYSHCDTCDGIPFEIFCVKNYWKFDVENTTQEEFAQMLSTAEKCKDFKLNKELDEEEK